VIPARSASRSPRPLAISRRSVTAASTSSGFRLTKRPTVPASLAVMLEAAQLISGRLNELKCGSFWSGAGACDITSYRASRPSSWPPES
jgi:hypothetical protein